MIISIPPAAVKEKLKRSEKMLKKDFIQLLKDFNACNDAEEWCTETKGGPQALWNKCERGDWMLWLIGEIDPDRKRLVLTACKCARLALKCVKKGDNRPLKAIETAEAWANGKKGVSLQDVKDAAAYAADAADAAADAAHAAAYAAHAAVYSAADAAYAAAAVSKQETLKKCADIVRKHYPKAPKI